MCDICRTTYADNPDHAAHCESGGVPVRLPAGTPLLRRTPAGFALVPLTPTDRIVSAVRYNSQARPAHHRDYDAPSTTGSSSVRYGDAQLSPLQAGYLQSNSSEAVAVGALRGTSPEARAWASHLFGLVHHASPLATGDKAHVLRPHHAGPWAAPITAPVRAVLDALGAFLHLEAPGHRMVRAARQTYVLGLTHGNLGRASTLLNHADPARFDAHVTELQERWFAGEDVSAPEPYVHTRSTRTPSKLTRELRDLIAATGVEWEPRTTAGEYIRTLVKKALMTDVKTDTTLFPGARIVAVGGTKGGVGKSTTAAALAAALAGAGMKVLLLDLDVAGPSQHLLWNLGPVPVDTDGRRLLATATDIPGLSVFSSGQVGDGLPRRWDDETTAQWLAFLTLTLDAPGTDVLVLDLPPGMGALEASITSRQMRTDVLVHVTTAHPLALEDTTRGLCQAQQENARQVVVENMSRVSGVTADGTLTEVRLFADTADAVAALADATRRTTFGGSLPWESDHRALARSAEMVALAVDVLTG